MSVNKAYFDALAAQWDNNPEKWRRASVAAQRIEQLNLLPHGNLIDYGCGTGLLGLQLLGAFQHIYLADASEAMLQVAQAKINQDRIHNASVCQVEQLADVPVNASAITMLMVLHHILDLEAFFQQAYRKLDTGGAFIVVDLVKEDGSFHQDLPDFDGHNGFELEQLSKLAQKTGFKVGFNEAYDEIYKQSCKRSYPLFMLVAYK
ncbi:methyltransferase domain-containing protein [Celerinatantimonas sp. YJH-8]|uniref:methyltransferase domain-containing protein n=1 Tax=Celerinatantimonas sp. YJH-8 TaxID=3228714 RepID=UPI0038C74D4D